MGRTGVEVGQVYEWHHEGGALLRQLQVTEVRDGQATCTILKWRGQPKKRGMRCMLPDDYRYKLVV